MFPEWSDRTFATYYRAFLILSELGTDVCKEALLASVRPNGSFNVSKFSRLADMECMKSCE
jgi:hypothetical protein